MTPCLEVGVAVSMGSGGGCWPLPSAEGRGAGPEGVWSVVAEDDVIIFDC